MEIQARGTGHVTGVLAVSMAIQDLALSELVIATPGVASLPLMGDQEFLNVATDGLWDLVPNKKCMQALSKYFFEIIKIFFEVALRISY